MGVSRSKFARKHPELATANTHTTAKADKGFNIITYQEIPEEDWYPAKIVKMQQKGAQYMVVAQIYQEKGKNPYVDVKGWFPAYVSNDERRETFMQAFDNPSCSDEVIGRNAWVYLKKRYSESRGICYYNIVGYDKLTDEELKEYQEGAEDDLATLEAETFEEN